MIIPVVCILLLLCHHLFIQMIKRKSAWVQYGVYIKIIGVGLIAGLAFIWSNDYGISCWVCLLVMTFIVAFSRTRKIKYALLYTIFEMFISTLWIFIFVEIITLGHFRNWFLGTFGTGGYQNWYYNSLGMSFFLFDVDFSFLMLIEGFLCVIYLIKLFVCHADTRSLVRYGVPAFIIMTGFCAGNEYKLLSGGELRQMALSALFLTVLYEFLVFVCSYGKKKKICEIVIIYSSIVSLAWIISDFKQEVLFWKVDEKIGQYISQLGGRITSLGQDLTDTSRFLDGDSFFATYASAQEVVENTFQPSGTDYIIHALGDSQREKYLNSFKKGDFTYTATIKETYELYEYWCQRANWFLYRELYDKWHPVYANAYEKYWARNTQEETHTLSGKYNIEVENVDESTKKLILRTDKSVNGVADVYIDYAVKKKDNRIAKLLFHSVLKVQNTGTQYAEDEYYEYNYLRNAGNEYIPVTVVDGYGEVTLTSLPDAATHLELYESSCDTIYNVIYDYVEASFVEDKGAEILVATADNKFNEDILKDIAGIMIEENVYQVLEVRKDDGQLYIVIPDEEDTINIDDSVLDDGNMFQIVR